jgi:hypothetical protein
MADPCFDRTDRRVRGNDRCIHHNRTPEPVLTVIALSAAISGIGQQRSSSIGEVLQPDDAIDTLENRKDAQTVKMEAHGGVIVVLPFCGGDS